ncbi:hypothetical protein V6N12_044986 [Hibiscus sabdariffa]|uniref:Endonuclease/exonuclease/phosphatase domain-containing protein n=1 Tax=Hibiscus sabdariffa TaxID=183260 RepID=A0ABR2G1N3_9ROSI
MIRKGLWHNLAALKSIFDEPWLLGGDFNNILQMEEREGGSVLSNGDHPQFEEFLRKSWDTLLDVHTNIRAFQFKVQRWNISVFAHIGSKKKELLARIRGIDRGLRRYHYDFLIQLDTEFRDQLDEVLCQEGSLWIQKSRVQWAQFGDRNTSYFHNRAMQQRRTNFVEALRDSDGAWCSDR